MTLDYYRIFYYVSKYKSFSNAARMLDNNQPNITRCMNILESELDCKLLNRSHKGITLTPEGNTLYSHVSIAMKQLEDAENAIIKSKSLSGGTICIGVSEIALRIFLLKKLEKFTELFPDVKIKLTNHSTNQAVNALKAGLVDFAVVTTPVNLTGDMKSESLCSFHDILIAGPKYSQPDNKIIHLEELQDYPFISLAEGTGTHDHYTKFFYDNNLHFNLDMEASTTDQVLAMVQANLGLGFYPEELASEYIMRGEIFPVNLYESAPDRDIVLIRESRHTESIAAKKLINFLKHTTD